MDVSRVSRHSAGRWPERGADERGIGMITAVIIGFVVFALGATWTTIARHEVNVSHRERGREQALQAAEAGAFVALEELAANPAATAVPLATLTGTGSLGQYEASMAAGAHSDERVVTATGYWPSKTDARVVTRQVVVTAEFVVPSGFNFGLFAQPGYIDGDDNVIVTGGDVYAQGQVELTSGSDVAGSVLAWGGAEIAGSVGADVHVVGDVVSTSDVAGNVLAAEHPTTGVGGNVTLNGGSVGLDVVAPNSVMGSPPVPVAGVIRSGTQPTTPPWLEMPDYTWNASDYSGYGGTTARVHASVADFQTWYDNAKANVPGYDLAGAHRVDGTGSIQLTAPLLGKLELDGDFLLYAPSADIEWLTDVKRGLLAPPKVQFALLSEAATSPAVELRAAVSMGSDIEVLVYAPEGMFESTALAQEFHGVVYAADIHTADDTTVNYAMPTSTTGFTWAASQYTPLRVQSFHEPNL